AYTVLPPSNLAPAPDSPAELWVTARDGSPPDRLSDGVDLLVHPLWAPDGTAVIARRVQPDGSFALIRVAIADGAGTAVITSSNALFPIAFDPQGALLYASISTTGSDLRRLDAATSADSAVVHLSDDLTRDWTLSPDGARLAFVALAQSAQGVASRIAVADLATGAVTAVDSQGNAFGPAWSADGRLTFGRLTAGGGSIVAGEGSFPGARGGFDSPLAWSNAGRVALRTFETPSLTAPGRESLTIMTATGARRTIASGEVTFIGWTYR
ncbi:MAG TPA: hypothetical protein VH951_09330, partial [Dehalococcoidia bacterium]